MSIDYYYRRLCYRDNGGVAKEGDLKLVIHSPPIVLAKAVEIDFGEVHPGILAYDPYIRDAEGQPKRDMTPPEIIVVRRWLFGLLAGVMRAATIPIPLEGERRETPR